jgi:Flp pilus assembly protein TadD
VAVKGAFQAAHAFVSEMGGAGADRSDTAFADGALYMMEGRCAEAVSAFAGAAKAGAPDPTIVSNLGWARLECGDLGGAEREFAAVLEASRNRTDHFESNLGLAIIFLRKGDNLAAIEKFRKAAGFNPKLRAGVKALSEEGYVYTPGQAASINSLLKLDGGPVR